MQVLCQQKGWDRKGGWGHCKVLCTCWLLGLAVKSPWLAPSGPIPALVARIGQENTTLTLWVVHFWQSRLVVAWALSRCLPIENAGYCMLVNEWAWLRSWVCLSRLRVHLGSVLESELIQKWRYVRWINGMHLLNVVSSGFDELKVHIRHSQNVCVKGLHEPYRSLSSAFIINKTIIFAEEHH